MRYVELVFLIIPIFIIFNISNADSKKIKKVRFLYSIPSILTVLSYGVMLYFEIKYNISKYMDFEVYVISGLLDLICFIFYNGGKPKEKIIMLDTLSDDIDNIRSRSRGGRHSITIETEEVEKL